MSDKTLIRKAYDANIRTRHPRNDYRSSEAKQYTRWMDRWLAPYIRNGCRLLDIGCSSGKMTFMAESLGAQPTGIDFSYGSARLAREIADDINSSARFVQGDFVAMPFSVDSFDIAIFPQNIVECSYETIECLASELRRVLVPNGYLFVTMKDFYVRASRGSTRDLKDYNPINGRIAGNDVLPDNIVVSHPTYAWSVAFAVHVFCRRLSFYSCTQMDDNLYFIAFQKGNRR